MSIADKYTTLTSEKIPKVYEAGYEKGKAEGGDPAAAYEQGVADGKKSEYDAFWDAYQEMGGPQQYVYSFAGRGWDDRTFKPKYDIIMRYSCLGAFQYNELTDIAQALLDRGVTLDTSGASSLQAAFAYSKTKRLPVISAEGATSAAYIFEGCTGLERIEKFVLVKKNVLSGAFQNCTKLKDIVFEGEIGYNTNLQYSPLSKDSITSVLGVLSDTTSGLTLTLNKAAVENAFKKQYSVTVGNTDGDGFYYITLPTLRTISGALQFSTSMDVRLYVGDTAFDENDDPYVEWLPEPMETAEGVEQWSLDDPFYDYNYYYFRIKRTDGKPVSEEDVVLIDEGDLSEWDNLIATKPNWTINLV